MNAWCGKVSAGWLRMFVGEHASARTLCSNPHLVTFMSGSLDDGWLVSPEGKIISARTIGAAPSMMIVASPSLTLKSKLWKLPSPAICESSGRMKRKDLVAPLLAVV